MRVTQDPAILPLPGLAADARPLLVGYSGGLDSTVLLHRLAACSERRARGLRAIHVHHGLHPDADAWAEHCRHHCDALGLPLQIARVAVGRDSAQGPEGAARAARYAAFASALRPGEVLVLAHHRGDQAETFLLRALRASGADGLASMRPWRRHGPGWLWRPLLDLPRGRLLDYARAHGLRWIDDPSNAGIDPDRNFLRHRVLPLLRERWPQAEAAFAGSAGLSAQAAELLAGEDAAALAQARTADPHALDVAYLRGLPAARRARVLRHWIAALDLPPLPARGVAWAEDAVLADAGDRAPRFAWSGAELCRWRGLLHADRQRQALPHDFRTAWDGRHPLALPDGDALALIGGTGTDTEVGTGEPPPAPPWTVHARTGGERMRLPGREHSHTLKHVLQDLGVPPWVRARLPLLSGADGDLLAAGDLICSRDLDTWLRDRRLRLQWSQADSGVSSVVDERG